MNERELFENWAMECQMDLIENQNNKEWPDDTYEDDYTQTAWESWQARAELLPFDDQDIASYAAESYEAKS